RAGDDVEDGGAGDQQQHQGGAEKQDDVFGAGNDDFHDRTFPWGWLPSASPGGRPLSTAARAVSAQRAPEVGFDVILALLHEAVALIEAVGGAAAQDVELDRQAER